MKQRLIQTVARSARLKILNELKRTQGLPVADLADRLGMSYMGIKGLCVEMAKRGLLDTWRQPVPRGRPQMLYRLTQRAHDLFPVTSNDATIQILDAARQLFGATAPEKLLLIYFQKLAAGYEERLRPGTPAERAKWFARLRDHDGYMSDFFASGENGGEGAMRIVEHHSPLLDLLRAYPIVAKLETDLFKKLLGAPVHRAESAVSGLFSATFEIG